MKRLAASQISDINITPLTDVFLVLLVIMMIVTPMMNFAGLPLSVSTSKAEAKSKEKVITINVNAAGKISIRGAEIARLILAAELRARLSDNPEGVVVMVHPNAPYEAMTYALGAIYQAGILRVVVREEEVNQPQGGGTPAPRPAESKS